MNNLKSFEQLQDEINEWGSQVFGMHRSDISILKHMKKEIDELIQALDNFHKGIYAAGDGSTLDSIKRMNEMNDQVRLEYADLWILLLHASRLTGLTTDFHRYDIERKMIINKRRKWGKPDADGVIEHIEEGSELTTKDLLDIDESQSYFNDFAARMTLFPGKTDHEVKEILNLKYNRDANPQG